jgi:pimeloyl-ACP methyl ester carboxylesterase
VGLSGTDLEVVVAGSGEPVTVAAHGLGATLAETRPLLSGVAGTRVLYAARGHGASPLPDGPLGYPLLADDLLAVADAAGAGRALGVSLGASTVLAALARQPERFEAVVLFLPAALDRPRTDAAVGRLADLRRALDAGDAVAVAAEVAREVPAALLGAPAVQAWARQRAAFLLASPGVRAALRDLPDAHPVTDRTALSAVTAEVLLLAQEGDPLHPADIARELAAVLPRARSSCSTSPGWSSPSAPGSEA